MYNNYSISIKQIKYFMISSGICVLKSYVIQKVLKPQSIEFTFR